MLRFGSAFTFPFPVSLNVTMESVILRGCYMLKWCAAVGHMCAVHVISSDFRPDISKLEATGIPLSFSLGRGVLPPDSLKKDKGKRGKKISIFSSLS